MFREAVGDRFFPGICCARSNQNGAGYRHSAEHADQIGSGQRIEHSGDDDKIGFYHRGDLDRLERISFAGNTVAADLKLAHHMAQYRVVGYLSDKYPKFPLITPNWEDI
jgi:hypothetical protein